jgi:probable addiction module antidote protein
MGKTKTLGGRKKSQKKSITVNGVKLLVHDPQVTFKNHKEIKMALAGALLDGDKEAFIEILAAYVRIHNILQVCRITGLSRTVVYEAISKKANPSLDTLCKIMTSFDRVA